MAFISRVHGSAANKSELEYYIIPMRIVMRIMVDAPRGTITAGAAPKSPSVGDRFYLEENFLMWILRRSQEVSVAACRRHDKFWCLMTS